jgi:NIPSNAP
MHRRTFVGALGGLGLATAATSDKRTAFYLFQQFHLKSGSQLPRLHDFMSQSALPAFNRIHSGPKIFLEATIAAQIPHVTAIYGFSSMEELWGVHAKMSQDEDHVKGLVALESGPDGAFESMETTVVEAADYSPEIKPEPAEASRIFELRVYHSPTWRQLIALHERFRGPEIKIFHRSGIHPILYATTFIGPNQPNLTYLIPFADMAAREKAWAAFGADPDWQKVRKESVEKSGEIVSNIRISFYKSAPYSPIK